jgi:hypothetical protein
VVPTADGVPPEAMEMVSNLGMDVSMLEKMAQDPQQLENIMAMGERLADDLVAMEKMLSAVESGNPEDIWPRCLPA